MIKDIDVPAQGYSYDRTKIAVAKTNPKELKDLKDLAKKDRDFQDLAKALDAGDWGLADMAYQILRAKRKLHDVPEGIAGELGRRNRAATMKAAGSDEVEWLLGEVFDQKASSGGTPRKLIEDFLEQLATEGQVLHKQLAAAVKKARATVQGGEKVTEKDVVEAVRHIVTSRFGEDPLAKAVTKAIATGDGFF